MTTEIASMWEPIVKNLVLGKDKTVEVSASTIKNLCVFAEKTADGLIKSKNVPGIREIENQMPIILKALCDMLVEEKLDFYYVSHNDVKDNKYILSGDVKEIINIPFANHGLLPNDNLVTSRMVEIQSNLKTILKDKFIGNSIVKIHLISLFLSDANNGTNVCVGIRYADEVHDIPAQEVENIYNDPEKLKILQDRAEIANQLLKDFPDTFSLEYVAKHIMGLTEKEIQENTEYWNKSKGIDVIEESMKILNSQITTEPKTYQECAQLEVEDLYSKSADSLADIMNLQKDIQETVYGYNFDKLQKGKLKNLKVFIDWNEEAIRDEQREFANALTGVDTYPSCWKPWKSKHNEAMNRSLKDLTEKELLELKYEWIDIFIFLTNQALAIGLTPKEVYNLYMAKNKENKRRQFQPGGY